MSEQNNEADLLDERTPKKVYRNFWFLLVVVLVLMIGFWTYLKFSNFPWVAGSSWQAVFLNNNQVYFGHLHDYNRGYVVMDNIFYLRVAEPLQQGAQQQPSLNLVKLGSELHGPEDMMYIPKSQIMFWENLKKDSAIVTSISSYLSQQPK